MLKACQARGDKLILDFTGKSGQRQHQEVIYATLARIIKQLDELPRYEIFQYYNVYKQLVAAKSHPQLLY